MLEPLIKDTRNNSFKSHIWSPSPIVIVDFNLRKEDIFSIKDKIAGPNISIIPRFHYKLLYLCSYL